jgi:FAD/FMN-containing dehydrogenase
VDGAEDLRVATRVLPDDRRYPTLVRGFNQRWAGNPRYVEVVTDADQVVDVVQRSVDAGLRPTVRSGGHCYEGWSSRTDGVIIDVSGLRSAGRDPSTGWYFMDSGCTNWDLYDQLYRRFGRTLPAGSCYSVGAGGHICGGGYGLLSRLHGLTVDWLDGVEVVCVDRDRRARRVVVRRDSALRAEQDLWWAHTGGGGGNFGVITRYFFSRLPEGPSEAWLASLAWEWEDLLQHPDLFARLVRNFGRFFEQHSAPDSPYAGLFALLHLTRKAAGQIVLTVQNVGPDAGPADRRPVDQFLEAVEDGVDRTRLQPVAPRIAAGWYHYIPATPTAQRMPWLEATQTLNGSGPNRRGKYKSTYMKQAFPERQLETIWRWLTVESGDYPANSQALLQVDSYGCRINEVDPAATAVAQRSSVLKLQYQTYWADEADDAANLRWIDDFYTDMYGERGPWPDDVVDGCYVNYCDSDLVDWPYLYYKDNYPRLQRAKAHWDPHNIFNHPQSIEAPNS